ncbi:MAG: serine hydrolase domain-containing protein [Pseudomonadota bacterium]
MGLVMRFLIAFVALALAVSGWLAWPLYGYAAHAGEAPLLPFGWIDMPREHPTTEMVLDPRFAAAGAQTLAAMEAHRDEIDAPGFSAAVAIGGEVVWQGAVGWADLARGEAVTPETIFRIGSTSKAVTGAALARLVDQGTIDLDAPIERYLHDLPNPEWAGITPRMLASHTAGLPHYGDNDDRKGWYHSGALVAHYDNVHNALELFDDSTLLFEPGTDFEYSSYGTVLLGAVIADAADLSYRELVTREVFAPAGMRSTIVAPKRHGKPEDLARFYLVDSENDRARPWRPVDLSHRLPGGGWASTPTDLVRMGAMMLDDGYISAATRDEMWTPVPLANGEVNEQDYALGWRWRAWEEEGFVVMRNANHGGVSRGSQCWLVVYPDFDMAIAYTINTRTEGFRPFGAFLPKIAVPFGQAVLAQQDEG